ncbi:MAG: hypothetical protein K2L93_08695 [Muribaculaceae bacterium]|nr:hypothetical protein [Muribaculaceae bacterium]
MEPKTKRILWRCGKGLIWTVVAVVLLVLGLITQLVKILAPERLTPLVERVAESYLDADVQLSRVELTFWSTFPRLTLDVDSMCVVSNSLRALSPEERQALPIGADTLLTFSRFNGGVNLAHLSVGRLTIYDVTLDEPMINIVDLNERINNYDILRMPEDTTPFEMPNIAIDCFKITNAKPWRYTSVSDSISGSLQLTQAQLVGSDAPYYKLEFGGDFDSPLLKEYEFDQIVMGLNGKLKWEHANQHTIGVEGLTLAIDRFKATVNAAVDMTDDLKINQLDLKIDPVDIGWLASHCPKEYMKWIEPFATDMTVAFDAHLTQPYALADTTSLPSISGRLRVPECYINTGAGNIRHFDFDMSFNFDGSDAANPSTTIENLSFALGVDSINVPWMVEHAPADVAKYVKPLRTDLSLNLSGELTAPYCLTDTMLLPSFTANIDIPECSIDYGKARFKRFAVNADVEVDGTDLDNSVLTLSRLLIEGPATRLDIDGKLTFPISDPLIIGHIAGRVNLSDFPPQLRNLIPAKISGRLTADANFNLRQSYLNRNNFYRTKVTGSMALNDFRAQVGDSLTAWVNNAQLRLGTSEAFVRNDQQRVDSLLTVSFKIDTATIDVPGVDLRMANLAAGLGMANRSSSSDTSAINPIGGSIKLGRLNIVNHVDSTRLRLRDLVIGGTLSRYLGESRVPRLGLLIGARRASLASPTGRYFLREADFKVVAHLRPPKKLGKKSQALYDSLQVVHPELSPDSLLTLTRETMRDRRNAAAVADDSEVYDFGLDNSMKTLLRRWDVTGELKAKRGRVFTPYFPLRNTVSNVNCQFSLDTITITDTHYKVGQTDFTINGSITNLRRALTSRRHVPLNIDLKLKSDTIQVNEITRAIFAGGAYSSGPSRDDVALLMSDEVSEEQLDKAMNADQDTVSGPLLIPTNIDATFNIKADNIVYSDMLLHRFQGDINMHDGALNLNELSAHTDIGSVGLTALYTAPNVKNMEFGFGMDVNDFHIGKFVTLFPTIDSVMPMLSQMDGIVNAQIAATMQVDSLMNIELPTLRAAVKIEGDSLVLLDADTFKTLSKWLLFKQKDRNMIDHMAVEMVVDNSQLQLYPFMFDIDRYRLGVMGRNDMALNLDYHISVLKSPLPFKFGINVKGTFDDMKIRMGGAKFKENMVYERVDIVDTTRVNLVKQIENVFRRGVRTARLGRLKLPDSTPGSIPDSEETPADESAIIEQYNSASQNRQEEDKK